eukprot:CAMPEP_0198672154 /NCGR_PEP_ID=MMETSP1467-20131203/89688_1 /TAXON_ID=1462469 /ORGANISM="unid. sp., Strain CCMP2135" /LENGTH=248 /DNA_ID=CAMNT_0044408985 /DNA_START=23 /DNA_END=766 /DNA_ORIENTATION=+
MTTPCERRALLGGTVATAMTASPALAMWQMWQPEDMVYYVDTYGEPGNATSVLAAMDKCASTSWMMNMGAEKGAIVEEAFRNRKSVLEVGTFLSYMSIRIAAHTSARVTTVEIDRANFDAATLIRDRALSAEDKRRVLALNAPFRQVLPRLSGKFDAVLMDHWKADYAADLDALARSGRLADGALVVADNVLFPGAPELLDYLGVPFSHGHDDVSGQPCLRVASSGEDTSFASPHFDTVLVPSAFEYR